MTVPELCRLISGQTILTLDVQEHALLMTSDPALRLAVESTQVGEPHAADGQHGLAVTAADFKTPVLTLKTQTQTYCQALHHYYRRTLKIHTSSNSVRYCSSEVNLC